MNEGDHPDTARVALVTGAAKRIGREIALALADAGWDIAVHFHRSHAEAEATVAEILQRGRRAVAFACDLADEAQVRALLPAVQAHFGAVRCVVNNASLFEYDQAADFGHARLDAHMHTNLAAPVLLAQALHAATPAGSQGVVINLLDQKLYNLNPDFLSYTLSKAALHSAIPMLAQALAPKVRVVGVAPGLTLISHLQTGADFAATHGLSPLGESSRPDEVAQAVVFAAQNRAMTGSTMLVDGGQHLVRFDRDFSMMNRNQ
ncbi:NAD(P)-dependent dehydrogenase (short-subunit alcohol dehydrogenase family) [Pseudoduganella lurida]|uniref:NAD(P)-dependent dehydrogenase (Short-subunit alcohol dehydrogenase family) n=2 Tax=Pseudoduganella lurida TaxID=1036180 RepID=A0A562R263_9BURK|nr:NAD(P)-dependent dehydrogenase (short-subunit alcohol dehydrogenase family) [Pseudoduganella lurida]